MKNIVVLIGIILLVLLTNCGDYCNVTRPLFTNNGDCNCHQHYTMHTVELGIQVDSYHHNIRHKVDMNFSWRLFRLTPAMVKIAQ